MVKKGKTAQFWLGYLDMLEQQHHLYVGIQEKSFEARINTWQYFYEQVKLRQILLLILILRSYYLHQMKNREAIDSDLKVPASVQEQNRHNIQTPIHWRGEQTLSKQAKTDGEKKGFAANTNTVANRSYQAKKPQLYLQDL